MSRLPNSFSPAPYRGARVALGTRHGKERAVAPPFVQHLGALVVPTRDLDTDAFGTFTGEVPRVGGMVEAARAKARAAMAELGLPLGIGSEGSFGPHPLVPWLPLGMETLVFVDESRGIEVVESRPSRSTNFAAVTLQPDTDLPDFLARVGFPEHALVVRAAGTIEKGVRTPDQLDDVLRRARAHAPVSLETDMRAHLNPTRMAEIGALADRLATRLAISCPNCGAPGYGERDVVRGLPCEACGGPTGEIAALVHACSACGHATEQPRPDGRATADPAQCPACNP